LQDALHIGQKCRLRQQMIRQSRPSAALWKQAGDL
jgi:hypothetical protein